MPPDTFKKTARSAIPAVARSRIIRAIQCKVLSTDCIKDVPSMHVIEVSLTEKFNDQSD